MRIAITGSDGQLGHDLLRVLAARHEVVPVPRRELDVTDTDRALETMARIKPHAIVHAAGYTNVDRSEENADAAFRVNALGARNMAVAAQRLHAKLVFVSSGYVFDGRKAEPYDEFDDPSPINVYGSSKLAGERFVQTLCDRYFIVRTSWMYGASRDSFVSGIVSLMRRQAAVSIVDDKFGSPTHSLDLARFIGRLAAGDMYGVYHGVNDGGCSRYEFVEAIAKAAGLRDVRLVAVGSDHFRLPAARPDNSVLAQRAIRLNGLPLLCGWREALQSFFDNDWKG